MAGNAELVAYVVAGSGTDPGAHELRAFIVMEADRAAAEYILPYTLERHQQEYERDDIVYLSILRQRELAGFFILALEEDGTSVEFRRIVVADRGRGTGQHAILAMETYCRHKLKRERIWLDVFEDNDRGRHVYGKLGYREFDYGTLQNRRLIYMQKSL